MISGAKKKRPTLRVPSFSGVVGWGGIVLQLGRPWEGGTTFVWLIPYMRGWAVVYL